MLSILIPAFNEEKLIGASLAAVHDARQALADAGRASEIVVCDNNSTDRTAELATAAGARVVFEPVNQIGRARNRAAAGAQGDWLLFLDADSFPSRPLFAELATVLNDPTCLGGGATVELDERHPEGEPWVWLWNRLSRLTRWAPGSFLFCRAAAFRELGGFNLELFASEEIDLSRRMKRLARRQGQRLTILHRHPLRTSARKLHLYRRTEVMKFLFRYLLQPRRSQRSREVCRIWYDGRR